MNKGTISWIAADWGTTNLRVWAMSSQGQIIDGKQSTDGMGTIAKRDGNFEGALLALIEPWLSERSLPIIACGMVGAKQGWQEVPYAKAPCSPTTPLTQIQTQSDKIEVYIHSGVSQEQPADVMRGEETQVSGLLAEHPHFEGLVCLPGTHSKWVVIRNGTIQSFRTYLTGEIFSLLSKQSILRLTTSDEGWDDIAFHQGVIEAYEYPEQLLSDCFALRAESLLHNLDPISAHSQLSGLVIGHELSGALSAVENPNSIALISSIGHSLNYKTALEALGQPVQEYSATELTLSGFRISRDSLL
jgi:2-dehydro-3-deoxygalactonokinase